jgi:hypothetical protein
MSGPSLAGQDTSSAPLDDREGHGARRKRTFGLVGTESEALPSGM